MHLTYHDTAFSKAPGGANVECVSHAMIAAGESALEAGLGHFAYAQIVREIYTAMRACALAEIFSPSP